MQAVEIFPWNKNFATSVPVIDEQHKKLVQLINLLAEYLVNQPDQQILNEVFEELANYAAYHFETEEAIWRKFLPEDELEHEHKVIHASFINDIESLKQQDKINLSGQAMEDVLRFLIHWLVFHILESDMHMAKVVLAIQSGMSPQKAKDKANKEMRQHIGVLVETILTMYEKLSSLTLDLNHETTNRKKAETKLRLASDVIANTLDAVCITDSNKNIIEANPAFYKTTQFSSQEVIGRNIEAIKTGLGEIPLVYEIEKALAQDCYWSGIISSRNKQGEVMMEWLSLSLVNSGVDLTSYYVAVFSEVTHLADRISDIEHLAYHDALTQLPNRLLLADRLELAIANADRKKELLAVCFIDLNDFKPINDQFGHEAGDIVLKTIAQRLLDTLRNNDTVARVGGDEFVLLLGDLKQADDYIELIERLITEIEQSIQLEKQTVKVTASIGLTIYPLDQSGTSDLIQHADLAMYLSKRNDSTKYQNYLDISDEV